MTAPAMASDAETAAAVPPVSPKTGRPVARRLEINFLLLTAGEFIAKILTFLAFSHLARTLGPETYGSLEFVLAVMVFFTLPIDLGLGAYGAREIARNKPIAGRLLREITGMRLILAVVSFGLLLLFTGVIRKAPELKILLAVYGWSLFAGPLLLQWFFQAHDLMHWVAAASIVRQGVFATVLFGFFRPGMPLAFIGVAECISVTVVALFCLYVVHYRMRVRLEWPSFRFSALLSHLRQGMPIGLTELSWAFIWYFATVILGVIFANEALGWFGASHRALMALHTFVWLYFFNLLPSISRCVDLPHDYLLGLMKKSVNFASWTSLFAAFTLTALSSEVIVLVFGDEFEGAGHSFAVLAWMLPVAMLSGHHRFALIAYNRQMSLLKCTAASAVIAVTLGLTLVPLMGDFGAAWALLIANIVNFALVYRAFRQHVVEIRIHNQLLKPLSALALAAAVFGLLRHEHLNPWIAAVAASFAYGAVLVSTEGRQILSFVRGFLDRELARRAEEPLVG